MSLFRKQKKNIRRRNVDSEDEENVQIVGEAMDVDICDGDVKKLKSKLKSADGQPKAATLLSFADDEGNLDDFSLPVVNKMIVEETAEVFQVRKSSYSKKLEKKLDKQRRRRKEKLEDEDEVNCVVDKVLVEPEIKPAPDDDFVVYI